MTVTPRTEMFIII